MKDMEVLAVLLHGPMDMIVTATFWELEANPLVVELGLVGWLVLKAALIVMLVWCCLEFKKQTWTYDLSFLLVVLGAVGIVPNLLVI